MAKKKQTNVKRTVRSPAGVLSDITARKRAEETIQRRNEELTVLNQTGQALSKLAEPSEILELVFTMVGRVLDNRNLYIALCDEASQSISFPVYAINGEQHARGRRLFSNGLTEYVINTRLPLLLSRDAHAAAEARGIVAMGTPMRCFLAVPMFSGDKVIGVIALQDYEKEDVYDEHHLELLTTIAAQATIALENARLYGAVQHELDERKRAEDALRESEEQYRVLFEGSTHGILATDIETRRFVYANPSMCRMLGYSAAELLQLGVADIHPKDALDHLKSAMQTQAREGKVQSFGIPCLRKDGTMFYADIGGANTIVHGRRCTVGFFTDVTERKRAEDALRESESRFRQLSDATFEGIVIHDQGIVLDVNESACAMTGYARSEAIGKSILEFVAPESRDLILDHIRTGNDQPCEALALRKDGSKIEVELVVRSLEYQGRLVRITAMRDITERKRAEEESRRAKALAEEAHRELQQAFAREQILARKDALTSVNNRRYWFELAEHEFEVATRYRHPLAVILFDIDHFKLVNDTFGHAMGDQVLERVAHVARAALRSADVIGRYGGEEFVIALPVTTAQQAYPVAERIRASVAAIRVPTPKGDAAVTLSIGIAEALLAPPTERPGGDDSVERVIQRADEAMYAAKQAGSNRTTIHSAPAERTGGST